MIASFLLPALPTHGVLKFISLFINAYCASWVPNWSGKQLSRHSEGKPNLFQLTTLEQFRRCKQGFFLFIISQSVPIPMADAQRLDNRQQRVQHKNVVCLEKCTGRRAGLLEGRERARSVRQQVHKKPTMWERMLCTLERSLVRPSMMLTQKVEQS